MAKFKILVPVDLQHPSEHAIDLALEMGHMRRADIYLFHVHEGRTTNYRELDRINEEVMERMKAIVIEAIQRAAAHGVTRTVEEVFRRMANGKAGDEILKMADAISADMIVMGHGSAGTAEKVLKKTPCTVMVARAKQQV